MRKFLRGLVEPLNLTLVLGAAAVVLLAFTSVANKAQAQSVTSSQIGLCCNLKPNDYWQITAEVTVLDGATGTFLQLPGNISDPQGGVILSDDYAVVLTNANWIPNEAGTPVELGLGKQIGGVFEPRLRYTTLTQDDWHSSVGRVFLGDEANGAGIVLRKQTAGADVTGWISLSGYRVAR